MSTADDKKRSRARINKKYRESEMGAYITAISAARHRKLIFNLMYDSFTSIRKLPCTYCGVKPSEAIIGIDRIDNDKGYIDGNVLPACGICNKVRLDVFSVEQMKVLGKVIKKMRKNKELK